MTIEYPTQPSSESDSAVDRLRVGLNSAAATTMATLRTRFYSLRFGDWFSIVLTLGVVAVAGTAFVGTTGALLAVGCGLSVALTLVMTNSSNPLVSGLGVVVGTTAGALSAAVAAFAAYILLQTGFSGLFAGVGLFALALASTGAFLGVAQSTAGLGITRSTLMMIIGIIGAVSLIGTLVAPRAELRQQAVAAAVETSDTVASAMLSVDPGHALSTFFILLAAALFFIGRTVVRMPFERVLPADRRSMAVAVVQWVQRWRMQLVRGSLIIAMATGIGLLLDATIPPNQQAAWLLAYTQLFRTDQLLVVAPEPLGVAVVSVVGSQSIRAGLYLAIIGSVAVLLAARLIGGLRRGLAWTLIKLAAPLAGGIAGSLLFGTLGSTFDVTTLLIDAAPAGTPPQLLELLQSGSLFVAGGVVVVVLLGVCVSTFIALGTFITVISPPDTAASTVLASIGLFGVAVAAVVVGLPLVAVGVAAAALCVWDVGEFGTTLRTELPGRPPTLRAETVHASGSVLYCSVGAVGAWLLYRLIVPQVQPPEAEIAAIGLLGSLGVAAFLAILLTRM